MKLWTERFQKEVDPKTSDLNSSISFDSRMAKEDIEGSITHVAMLGTCGVIERHGADVICDGLMDIWQNVESGKLAIDPNAEDIHTFVEGELTARVGDAGKCLHTARSHNDQVALDLCCYPKKECGVLQAQLQQLIEVLCRKAILHSEDVMSGYTHMQRAQSITFGHHLMAYMEMFLRDAECIGDTYKRMNVLPFGSGALTGTIYPSNHETTARPLDFSGVSQDGLDGVANRDFCIELAAVVSPAMVHLSRFSEGIILWYSWEFKFVELDDAFSTGLNIMPQRKDPDIAELTHGKSGRVFGDLMTLLMMLKGLPLAYNKDMQEDKGAILDAVDTLKFCLAPSIPMIETMKVLPQNMRATAARGFISATDCADYLVGKGLPSRDVYRITGALVAQYIAGDGTLETLPLSEHQKACPAFDDGVYQAISFETCVTGRKVAGAPAPENVRAQAERVLRLLEQTG